MIAKGERSLGLQGDQAAKPRRAMLERVSGNEGDTYTRVGGPRMVSRKTCIQDGIWVVRRNEAHSNARVLKCSSPCPTMPSARGQHVPRTLAYR